MKLQLPLLFCLLTLHLTSDAQWSAIANYGAGSAYSVAGFSIGNRAFAGGGNPGLKSFYEYDAALDTWTLIGDIPGNVNRASPIAFSINGKGYIGCGSDAGTGTTLTFYEFDPTSENWTKKADFPGGMKHSGFYAATATKGYVVCGSNGSGLTDDVYEYDPANDSWTKKASFPGGEVYWPAGFALNGKIYAGTGMIDGVGTSNFYEYDPATDSWLPKAPFPGDLRHSARGFAISNKGYLGGGANTGFNTTYTDFYEYDPTNDTWSPMTALNFPESSTAWSTSMVVGNQVFFGSGASLSGAVTPSAKFYKASIGTPTGLNHEPIDGGLTVELYPNPSSDVIFINPSIKGNYRITIYDLSGRVVQEGTYHTDSPSFSVSALDPGMYLMNLSNARATSTFSIEVE